MNDRVNLRALSKDGLFSFILEKGLPRYRAEQLFHWLYERNVADISGITEFSRKLRDDLSAVAYLGCPEVAQRLTSRDGTEKFLFRLEDGETIESVLIPDDKRLTLCVSSQAGCAMGCEFCLTGSLGLKRNLQAYEIVDQLLTVNRLIGHDRKVTNIVFMGMGEPLANLDAVSEALRRMTGLLGISKRRITLSTSGLAPKLAELASKAPDVNLAVSLNATTDEVRSRIMPVNRTYPLRTLLDACRKFPLGPMRRITFEYVLLGGLNDSESDARRLVGLVKGIRCKINLIPFNPHPGSEFTRPSEERVLAFQRILVKHDLTALIRESKGQDILAACGQLRSQVS